jgi:hypothetical protein
MLEARPRYTSTDEGIAAMGQRRRFRMGLGAGMIGMVLLGAVQAATARADGWTCAASAARAAIAGQGTAEPATAGDASAPCRESAAELSTPPLPSGVSAGALTARTGADDRTPAQASAAVNDVTLALSPNLVPTSGPGLVDAVPPVSLPGGLSADLGPALRDLLRPVPSVELLRLSSASASATGRCVAGDPVVTGSSSTAGAVLAGQPIDLDGPRSQAVELLGAYAIDPSDIDLARVVEHGGSLPPPR